MKYTVEWESNRKKHPYYGKSISTNFPGSSHMMGLVGYYQEPNLSAFSHLMGLPVFSHVMRN